MRRFTISIIIIVFALLAAWRWFSAANAAVTTYYVDRNNSSCSNSGSGTLSIPFCTLVPTASILNPGDTVMIANGRYGEYFSFTRSGSAGNPITFKATGDSVVVGTFVDLVDGNFTRTPGYTNVWQIDLGAIFTDSYARLYQTHFLPIIADDPDNGSNFTIQEADGPIPLTNDAITSNDLVESHEGSFRINGTTLFMHPYDHVTPSIANTDLVLGNRGNNHGGFNIEAYQHDLVFEGLTFAYSAPQSISFQGSSIQLKNITSSVGLNISGSNNILNGYIASNNIYRRQEGDYNWVDQAYGDGLVPEGTGNTFRNIHSFHNWNNIASGNAGVNNVVDGVNIHGSPNHCWYPNQVNLTIRNLVEYNCQDYQYIRTNDGYTLENSTVPTAVLLEGPLPIGRDFVFRNNIFSTPGPRFFNWISAGIPDCSFESKVVFENNLIFAIRGLQFSQNTKVAHCETTPSSPVWYELDDYLSKCDSGQLTGCATFRNNVILDSRDVSPDDILTGGDWVSNTDSWNIHLVAGTNAAVDAGSSSASSVADYEGDVRPQGAGYDIGADEYVSGAPVNLPPVLGSIGSKTVNEGQLLQFTLTATDAENDVLSFPQPTGLPSGATFTDNHNGTAVFTWTPNSNQSGHYTVTFTVSDTASNHDSEAVSITVADVVVGDSTPPAQTTDLRVVN